MNTWQSGSAEARARNRATLEGMTDYLVSRGATVGLYSTSYQWGQIVGTVPADQHPRRAAELAGRGDVAQRRQGELLEARARAGRQGHADPVRAERLGPQPLLHLIPSRSGRLIWCAGPDGVRMLDVSDDGVPVPPSADRPLRVAVVGAGPAGIYAAEALTRQDDVPVAVDLVDRLPSPFGLVRYGIAPDHPKMRAIRDTLHRTLDDPLVRFVGNVEIGADITLDELRRHVDAVIYTYGAALDRHLGIDGEDLPGSLAATEFVAWYTGHPDADRARVEAALAGARSVVVVGVGNVALDVARVLARTADELETTDMPQHVLDALAATPVEEITVLGRRGPAQATFTTQELKELGELAAATVLVDPAALEVDPAHRGGRRPERHPQPRGAARLDRPRPRAGPHPADAALLRPPGAHPRRGPGDRRGGRADGGGRRRPGRGHRRARGAAGGSRHPLGRVPRHPAARPAGRRAVGHRARTRRGGCSATAPSRAGEYVAGWIKRGPSGVVGTNKHDARETVASLLADVAEGRLRTGGPVGDLVQELRRPRAPSPCCSTTGGPSTPPRWRSGATRGRARTTLHEREALLAAVRAAAARPR